MVSVAQIATRVPNWRRAATNASHAPMVAAATPLTPALAWNAGPNPSSVIGAPARTAIQATTYTARYAGAHTMAGPIGIMFRTCPLAEGRYTQSASGTSCESPYMRMYSFWN